MVLANLYFVLFWLYHICYAGLVIISQFVPYLKDKIRGTGETTEKPLHSLIKKKQETFDEQAMNTVLNMENVDDYYRFIMK